MDSGNMGSKYDYSKEEIGELIKNPLFTNKHTTVFGQDYNHNAYNHFDVRRTKDMKILTTVKFQDGPVGEVGVNGIFMEDLLLMILNRLEEFQYSEYECRENEMAITKIEEAVMWLRRRTLGREARGVEGTHQV